MRRRSEYPNVRVRLVGESNGVRGGTHFSFDDLCRSREGGSVIILIIIV